VLSSSLEEQKAHDTLLTWCSEVGSGETASFLASCRELGLDPWSASRDLSQLGHLEFDWRGGRFAAAPPLLTTVPGVPSRLLLCGARPHGLLERLHDAAEEGELDVIVAGAGAHQFGTGPSTVLIEGDPADAPALCEASGIRWEPAAHRRLASLLAEVTPSGMGESELPDTRFPQAPVDPLSFDVRWDWDWDDGREGLWRYRTYADPRVAYLRSGAECLRLAEVEYGPYVMDRPADADPPISYRPSARVLVVEGKAPLPDLHARVACLCSGRVPLRQYFAVDTFEDHYVNVDSETARRIFESLGVDWGPYG
jgi:hypothetical protein